MKKTYLGIVAILAVFAMGACLEEMPISFDIPCVDDGHWGDSCEYLEKECNMAMPFGSICDLIPDEMTMMKERCEEWIQKYLDMGEGWNIDSGTCQDLMDVGGPCAEDADCMEGLTCNLDLGECE